jgi:multidrug efflux pump subunit AcrB
MQIRETTNEKGVIAWFASNHVAANLLMFVIIVAGVLSAFSIRKETQPEFELNTITVSVAYLGAGPEEVEEGVVVKIEESVQDIEGIKRIWSFASEGNGSVVIELDIEANLNEVMSEVKTRVDAISTFPGLTEKPVYSKFVPKRPVVLIAIHGELDPFARKTISQEVRNDLLQIPSVNQINNFGDRAYEISVEVSEQTLRKYGLTMSEISQAIRNSSVDTPGGTIKTDGGDFLLRTKGQVYTGADFSQLVLRTFTDGTRLTLGDIANIKDGFVETSGYGRFDGDPSVTLEVVAGGQQNEIQTAKDVKAYLVEKEKTLPDGVEMDTWIDLPRYLEDRLQMMNGNMISGALLVFISLSLFLRMKVAFWVILGLPISFLGALWLMPVWPVTVNTLSLFGFIIVLGIVVDDAIIIGESIYTKIRADGQTLDNVIQGAHKVAIPATFGVLTTIAAFAPMMFISGPAGTFFEAMSFVIILCLFFSLIESKLVLPAHLARSKIPPVDEDDLFRPQRQIAMKERLPRFFLKLQRRVQHGLQRFIKNVYRPMLEKVVDNRGLTLSVFLAVLILTSGLIMSGAARVILFPDVGQEFSRVLLDMESGTPESERDKALLKIESALLDLNDEHARNNPDSLPMIQHLGVFTRGETGAVLFVELPMTQDRPFDMDDVTSMWRDRIGEIPGMKELDFQAAGGFGGGPPISLSLSGENYKSLENAATELEAELASFAGVFDVANSAFAGGDEISLKIKPEAEALGLTQSSLGRQVRQAFYGEEAQRIQRGKDELRVMVRYPKDQRKSIADLENMRIRTPSGEEVPFGSVAEIAFGKGYSRIYRMDRQRTVTVSAYIDPSLVVPQEVIRNLNENFIPELLARHPGVSTDLEGSSKDQAQLATDMIYSGVIAIFLIYALIAIPLRSYSQPLLIMAVIPFAAIGAVIGHIVMGVAISMFSFFGLFALAGVVVNDSLIMVDFINKARESGVPVRQAVIESGTLRFRAIILTSFTTAVGLMPILFEKSAQAQYVIPTAISISFGIVFSTVITLFLIPSLFMLQLDGFTRFRKIADWTLHRTQKVPVAD